MPDADDDPPDPKRRYRLITEEERQTILDLYTHRGLSSVEIGRKLDRDPAIVRRVLHARGIPTPKLKWDADTALQLLSEGMSAREVALIVGKNPKSIRQYLARHAKPR